MNDIQSIESSDKFFWHRYIPFYESHFGHRHFGDILEFGVFRGDSIRWLAGRFPNARIFGLDILDVQPEWPQGSRISYVKIDQGNRIALGQFFDGRQFDLIVEDGSHRPEHQVNCLIEGLRSIRPGGLYVLEDIHTSLPEHEFYRVSQKRARWLRTRRPLGTVLSVLLAIDHLKRMKTPMTRDLASGIAGDGLFTPEEVIEVYAQFAAGWLYRRSSLPDRCFKCGSSRFNYRSFKCECGIDVFSSSDSMSFIVQKVP